MKQERTSGLEQLQGRILRARSILELMPELELLYAIAERKVAGGPLDGAALNRIARSLADLRFLLDELGSAAVQLLPGDAVRGMADRYRDLEGRVKERRNDRTAQVGNGAGIAKNL